MELETAKLKRKSLRTSFSLSVKAIDEEFAKEVIDGERLQMLGSQLQDKFQRLDEAQGNVSDLLLEDKVPEQEYDADFVSAELYRERYIACKYKIETHITKTIAVPEMSIYEGDSKNRKFKLPKLELKRFSGEAKQYLGFWSQFSKINDDNQIAPEDKFQYLIQAMIPDSRAAKLIESFPPTAENYPKAIEQLKERFGREDLLVQIYVRELLTMVMHNAVSGRTTKDLTNLYDQIESKLRALETLGRTKEKFADFLAPLVESCLPEDVLRAWERSRNSEDKCAGDSERSLEKLMTFLRQEVKGEEMISLARQGFGNPKDTRRQTARNYSSEEIATAATLVSTGSESGDNRNRNFTCVFCEKRHPSSECFSAQKMTLDARRKLVQNKGACFTCLKFGHIRRRCKANMKCLNCGQRHFVLMCPQREVVERKTDASEADSTTTSVLSSCSKAEEVFLQTLIVIIKINGRNVKIRAILDTGSQRCYVTDKIASMLKVKPTRHEKVIHGLFGGQETEPQMHAVYLIQVSDVENSYNCHIEAMSETKICGYVPKVSELKLSQELKANNIEISDLKGPEQEIDLLIGADVFGKLLTGKSLVLSSGLVAIETKLGWTVMGKQKGVTERRDNVLTALSLHVNNASVKELWELDILGISDPIEKKKKKDDCSKTIKEFQDKLVILPDGRYQVELPWKSDCEELSSNRELTLQRHNRMCKREEQRKNLDKYKAVFEEWEELKIIEQVPETEMNTVGHYLPHRPVLKSSSDTTKIRPVFDASAKEKGRPSLNDCLQRGPNLIESIPDILDRFRMHPVGLSADIEKAFLQLEMAPHDRDFLRFFYPGEKKEVVYRHCRVVFGVSSSPFLLGASISHLLDHAPSEVTNTVKKLKHSFYVDNCVAGVSDVQEMEEFIIEAKEIMSHACFNLRGWESNINCKYISKSTGDAALLGILWNLERDSLRCNLTFDEKLNEKELSKRLLLSTVQRVFDPLGLLAPTTLLPKIMLQETWKLNLSWDVPLPENLQKVFCKWFNEIDLLKQLEIQRYTEANDSSELHVFVDACKRAYAACIFLRSVTKSRVTVRLIRAKARVAPLKELTIPKLELMACCIGARLACSVLEALNLPDMRITLWCDSMVALWWIKEHGNWTVFVANRVKEIKQLTRQECWRYVPGTLNPADLLSRGCSPQQLLKSQWWDGPSWLREPKENWPPDELHCKPDEVDIEKKKSNLCSVNLTDDNRPWYGEKFSDFHSIIRLVAWIQRFVNNVRNFGDARQSGNLSLSEIQLAEKLLIKQVQSQSFPDATTIPIVSTFADEEGIIRVKTRITERKDDQDFLCPVLLPNNCLFTLRLVESAHRENCHAGTQMLLNILREKFWILKARKTVRNIVNACVKCRRFKAKATVSEPVPLPADRVKDATVFEVVGIDLAGPLYLKRGDKVWIVIFTCAIYRAIHLEITTSLSTESFLLALRRYIARRGRPRIIYSDNGTNFRGAYRELSELDWGKIVRFVEIRRITWKFNPPSAPWWGGWWERLVRVIKELLRRTLGKAVLTHEELETVLCDCEAVINSRPLTYLSENPEDLVPLTPAMFLLENYNTGVVDIDLLDKQRFQKRIRYRAKLIQDLRQRFRKEYLSQLVEKQNHRSSPRLLKLGEIVLIGDDLRKRLHWPLGKVVELILGKEGKVRTVKVKTQSGTLLRPVQRVFPLEVESIESRVEPLPRVEEGSDSIDEDNQRLDLPSSNKNTDVTHEFLKEKMTRRGRVVKVPKRLDLFNRVSYVFESFCADSKRGEDVGNEN